jgi:flagellar biogenesis protein FliO
MMKNRTCKLWLIGLTVGWLFAEQGLAAEQPPADTNTTEAADTNTTEVKASPKSRFDSASSQKIYGLPTSGDHQYEPKPVNLMAVVIRIFGALLAVLAILLGGAWWFRKSRLFGLVPANQSNLNIVETKSLGTRHALHVVEYGEKRFLIADSPAGTNFLTNLDSLADELLDGEKAPEPESSSFAAKLKSFLERKS